MKNNENMQAKIVSDMKILLKILTKFFYQRCSKHVTLKKILIYDFLCQFFPVYYFPNFDFQLANYSLNN